MKLHTTLSFLSILFLSDCFGNITIDVKSDPEQNCTCVPYYQCSYDSGDLITDGKGLLDLRILENAPCEGYFDVCCNVTEIKLLPTSTETPGRTLGCGYQNSGFFPWYAALFHQAAKDVSPIYRCGVSLIHSTAVITAAHCLNTDGIWTVQIGNLVRHVSAIIIHPEYNNSTMQNDIAIIILNEAVEVSEKINTICIPPPGTNLDNTQCRITSRIRDTHEAHFLKMLEVTVIPTETCVDMLRSSRLGRFFQLHYSFLCAGKEDHQNTCFGDGGSPLVCPIPGQPDRYHQTGIVSWGIGCGESNMPDVYIKVSTFRDWIDAEMIKCGLDITSYRY